MSYSASTYPYGTVVRITDTIGDETLQGSGVLISPDEVLTASHVVYVQGLGSATDIVVTPGYSVGERPYGSATGIYLHYFPIYDANGSISTAQSQQDYAVIHLSTPFKFAGSMGLQSNFAGGLVNTTGYPASAEGAQINSVQTVTKDPTYTLLDGTALGEGASGGPVWIEAAGGPEVVGLVSSASTTTTEGYNTLITTAAFNQIEAWVAQDDAGIVYGPAPPTISGTFAGQVASDQNSINPFPFVTITGANTTQTVSVTLSSPANGTLTNLAGGSYNAATGIYTNTASTAAITAALDGLEFTPTAHQVPPGQTVTTTFTITDTDSADASVSDSKTTVVVTPIPVFPTISGTITEQVTNDQTAIRPFSTVSITDLNAGQTETVTVMLFGQANGTLTNLGGGSYNPTTGTYIDTGSPAAVTSALDGLIFTPAAHQAAAGLIVITFTTINVTDSAGLLAIGGETSIVTTETAQTRDELFGSLNSGQQLELIYIAYFNRAADGGGNTFWSGQNTTAQNAGQSAATALTNIANSFEPQPETIALYPFLGGTNINLNTPTAQAGFSTFINSVYGNMFGHAPDTAGKTYWVGQITSGAVGLGAAALAIANGATGSDAIELLNKLAVAVDFTSRTAAAGLGVTGALPLSFLTAASSVLNVVDGTSLNDASVTAGKSATTTYIAGATTGHQTATASGDPNVITITGSDQLIDPGAGGHTIQFLTGASADTLVLHTDGLDQVSGFDPGTDYLDMSSLLAAANIDLYGAVTGLGRYLGIIDQGNDAFLVFDPNGRGAGSTVAVLQGSGGTVTDLHGLIARGAIRVA
jgi:V8-like Glu-specific endopeptidase